MIAYDVVTVSCLSSLLFDFRYVCVGDDESDKNVGGSDNVVFIFAIGDSNATSGVPPT